MTLHVSYSQAERVISIETVLGQDALLLERVEVREGISELFEIRASVRAQRPEVTAQDLVGTSADITLKLSDGARRSWNGLVTGLDEGPVVTRGLRQYVLTLRPRLWLMSQRADVRIHLDKSALDVVELLASEHGIGDIDLGRVVERPSAQHYSVQYNETDLAYLIRRLETSGLFYWFEHEQGRHTLVVGDHASAYGDGPEPRVRPSGRATRGRPRRGAPRGEGLQRAARPHPAARGRAHPGLGRRLP